MAQMNGCSYLKFLGTAGARFVMIKQLRASGGIWLCSNGTNVLIDPGPGSLVRCSRSRPKLDPAKLDGIILTHPHLDHSNDINVMIEAMTEGGFKKRGIVYCPQSALDKDAVVFKYLRGFPEAIRILEPLSDYSIKNFSFRTSPLHIHPVETYGLKFVINGLSIGLMVDTRYSRELEDFYRTDVLLLSVVFYQPRPDIDHLSIQDAENMIRDLQPKKAILYHFGMSMLKARPAEICVQLSQKLGIEVIAAYDGMTLEL